MKKILSLILTLSLWAGLSVPALAAEFTDVPAGHTFYSGIMDCAGKGITSGYEDGTFRPANPVTRAQFCVMLSRLSGLMTSNYTTTTPTRPSAGSCPTPKRCITGTP